MSDISNVTQFKKPKPLRKGGHALGLVHLPLELLEGVEPKEFPSLTWPNNKRYKFLEVEFRGDNPLTRLLKWHLVLERGGEMATGGLVYFEMDDEPVLAQLESVSVYPPIKGYIEHPTTMLNIWVLNKQGLSFDEVECEREKLTVMVDVGSIDNLSSVSFAAYPEPTSRGQELVAHGMALSSLLHSLCLRHLIHEKEEYAELDSAEAILSSALFQVEDTLNHIAQHPEGSLDFPPLDLREMFLEVFETSEALSQAEAKSEALLYLCELLAADFKGGCNLLQEHWEDMDEGSTSLTERILEHKKNT